MTSFSKNNLRADTIRRFGQESGLPLFESVKQVMNKVQQARLDAMPKSIPTGNDTKRLAHIIQTVDKVHLEECQQKVFELLLNEGPMTNKEMAERLGWDASTVSARNNELRALGLIRDAGKRQCNITRMIVHQWSVK
jgi:CRP-like cAMP-binding protein